MALEWVSVWGVKHVFENLDEARARLDRVAEKYGEMNRIWEETDFYEEDSPASERFLARMEGWCAEGSGLEQQIEKWEKELQA